jgi:hypothetical protein
MQSGWLQSRRDFVKAGAVAVAAADTLALSHERAHALAPNPVGKTWCPSPFGARDEVGASGRVGPAKVLQAARLIRAGRISRLGRDHEVGAEPVYDNGPSW